MSREDTKLVKNNLQRAPRPQVILEVWHLRSLYYRSCQWACLEQEAYAILDDFVWKDVQGAAADCCNMHLEQEFLVLEV